MQIPSIRKACRWKGFYLKVHRFEIKNTKKLLVYPSLSYYNKMDNEVNYESDCRHSQKAEFKNGGGNGYKTDPGPYKRNII